MKPIQRPHQGTCCPCWVIEMITDAAQRAGS
jgi:hypothetical protein